MNHFFKQSMRTLLTLILSFGLVGCANNKPSDQIVQNNINNANIVNVGVTDSVSTLNPLLMNGGEVTKYATGLMFLPLVELNKDLSFDYFIADSITTDDNLTFTVHVNPQAKWSDGTAVTAYDVEYTALRLCSPIIANTAMMYYVFEGVGEDGFVEPGATSIDGINVVDESTITFTCKQPMALNTFMNSYARYLMPLPKHMIENIAEEDLASNAWFEKPTVVSGPYMLDSFDVDHYVSYTANENYWLGKPSIEKLNIRIVDGAQLYAGLKSGEIDVTQQTMSVIPQEDYASVESLNNVTAVYGDAITNQSLFINTSKVNDVKVRQALLYAIDRETLVSGLLEGHGEVVDGFLSSVSPYYDKTLVTTTYDPEKAKALLQEANWDSSNKLVFYVNSGDTTMVNAANVLVAQWQQVGINVEINTVDFATLMSVAGTKDYDLLAVQYTYPPIDPYTDINWLLSGEGSWTGYYDQSVSDALAATQTESEDKLVDLYHVVSQKVQQDVPMISVYVIEALAAVNNRMVNVTPSVYGLFNNVHQWSIQ